MFLVPTTFLWALVVLLSFITEEVRCFTPPLWIATVPANGSPAASHDDDGGRVGDDDKQVVVVRMSWKDRVYELLEFREVHGHTRVPKRYPANPSLGNWVNKQRQMYRKYVANERPCSLTAEQIQVLNDVGFCWDPPKSREVSTYENAWWKRLEEFRRSSHDDITSSHTTNEEENIQIKTPSSSLLPWIRQQRREYTRYLCGESSKLDASRIEALNDVNPDWWKSAHQIQWETRCQELIAYKEQYGDCCVPITYGNRKLAHWVSNTRKNYNQKMAGGKSSSSLTSEQIEELNQIGFVWNRWDYEYESKVK